jgi:hypothetical protein
MDPRNQVPPAFSDSRGQAYYAGRRSLPPTSVPGPHRIVPSYPSSTLQAYYPPSPLRATSENAHIFSLPTPFGVLPSVSNDRVPSLRRTPSSPMHHPSSSHLHMNHRNNSPSQHRQNNVPFDQYTSAPAFSRSNTRSSLHNVAFQTAMPQTHNAFPIAAPQPIPLTANFSSSPKLPTARHSPVSSISVHSSTQFSHSKFSLPSTKDIPILSGKHDWGPWHSAVRSLILNANLLGHIADDPLPGATYDPGLWPTYAPSVHQGSTQHELQAFSDWWSRDGSVSHILTSRVTPSVLGSLRDCQGSTLGFEGFWTDSPFANSELMQA